MRHRKGVYDCSPRFKARPTTPKQAQLLELFASGMTLKEVAQVMRLNRSTVNRRLIFLRSKHDAVNTTHLIAKCLRAGVIA